MNKAELRKLFIKLRDECKNPTFETIGDLTFSKGHEYSDIYDGLEKAKLLDYDYFASLGNRNGYELAANSEKLSLKECGTVLTWFLRGDRFTEGLWNSVLEDGTIHKLLSRICETL